MQVRAQIGHLVAYERKTADLINSSAQPHFLRMLGTIVREVGAPTGSSMRQPGPLFPLAVRLACVGTGMLSLTHFGVYSGGR